MQAGQILTGLNELQAWRLKLYKIMEINYKQQWVNSCAEPTHNLEWTCADLKIKISQLEKKANDPENS